MAGEEPSRGAPVARRGSMVRWRVLLGAALITAAAGGVVFAHRAAQAPPSTRYVVLTQDVAAGEVLGAEALGAIAVDLPGSIDALPEESADLAIGRIAAHELPEAGLLRDSDLLESGRYASPDEIEVAVSLDPERLPAGSFGNGDLVTLLSSNQDSGTAVLADARVVSVESDEEESLGTGSRVRTRLSVADLATAGEVTDAAVRDTLTIVVPSPEPQAAS